MLQDKSERCTTTTAAGTTTPAGLVTSNRGRYHMLVIIIMAFVIIMIVTVRTGVRPQAAIALSGGCGALVEAVAWRRAQLSCIRSVSLPALQLPSRVSPMLPAGTVPPYSARW